jgi:hypothetical protein
MELTEFQACSVWCEKFVELRKRTEEIECKYLEGSAPETNFKVEYKVTTILNTLPATSCTLKQLTVESLTILSSAYTCENLFSAMN